ncbi:hypothetical protein WA026_016942 [Henosepilachna vigintioctopunctata]|uniref:Uncharacterized protein n=1 Tax=Henosepilachna vigintioctopunctata TaxID=420089 RepID=A0AAW1U9E1_9CUCU
MGNCFGKCLPKHEDSSSTLNVFPNSSSDLTYLDNVRLYNTSSLNSNIESFKTSVNGSKKSFLSRLLFKRDITPKKPVLQLVDGLLNTQNNYSRLKEPTQESVGSSTSNDIQLQCLDVRALLSHTNQSSPTTSLDLEWEHEIVPFFMVHDNSENSCTNISNDISRCPSDSSFQSTMPTCHNTEWSRVSSTNSLEWDSLCPTSPQMSEVDTDTQLLIGEIERLTRQTLLETGQDLLS